MSPELLLGLALCIFVVALIYSSVGHAGGSGYLAVMALFGVAPEQMKPTALALNVLVATIASVQFVRAGHFRWRLFWPFALLAVPLAFVGGAISLPAAAFKTLVGIVLTFAAYSVVTSPRERPEAKPPALPVALGSGGALGLLAGLTGTGGGVFLTPLLLLMRWASAKRAAAVSALFILANSSAGLLGNLWRGGAFPQPALALVGAAALGGALGSRLGSQRLPATTIKRVLALVLATAGGKLLWDSLAA
ncbi:MAG TPA: sulfite exporter TauE/SafE family protein [Myxococcota bacterium]